MRTKPVRLIITIILCVISFAFFGLADTIASYNTTKATINSILNNDYDTLAITSGVGALSNDIDYLKDKTDIEFSGVASYGDDAQKLPVIYNRKVQGNGGFDVYYNTSLCGYLPADKLIDGKEYKLIAGDMPKALNEIVLSKYIYEQFALGGIRIVDGEDVEYIEPEEIAMLQDFVNKAYFQVETQEGVKTWNVVGVVDTHEDPQGRYSALKPNAKRGNMSAEKYETLSQECMQYFNYSYHSLGYVTQQEYEEILALRIDKSLLGVPANGSITLKNAQTEYSASFKNVVNDVNLKDLEIVWVDGTPCDTLQDNEYVIGVNLLAKISSTVSKDTHIQCDDKYFDGLVDFSSMQITLDNIKGYSGLYIGACQYAQEAGENELKQFKDFIDSIGKNQDNETKQMLRAVALSICFDGVPNLSDDNEIDFYSDDFSDTQWRILYAGYLMTEKMNFHGMIDTVEGGYVNNVANGGLCGKEIQEKFGTQLYNMGLVHAIKDVTFDSVDFTFNYGDNLKGNASSVILGVYFDESYSDIDSYIINNVAYEHAQNAQTPEYAFLIAPMTKDKQVVKTLVNLHNGNDGGKVYSMRNSVALAMAQKSDTFAMLGDVFLYIGLGLAIFSMVLMSNYIAVSISSQKKQIGILRALGARSADVFAIFYSESLIIALVNFVIAALSALIASFATNTQIASGFGMPITFMIFGIRQVALIFALSMGVSLIASLVSIYSITKRKPVDCILDK